MDNIERYLELKATIADLTMEMDSIRSEWLADLPVGQHGRITIAKRTRIDLDKAAVLTAVGPDVYKNLEKISEYTVLQVK
jgi:hypothetical protein